MKTMYLYGMKLFYLLVGCIFVFLVVHSSFSILHGKNIEVILGFVLILFLIVRSFIFLMVFYTLDDECIVYRKYWICQNKLNYNGIGSIRFANTFLGKRIVITRKFLSVKESFVFRRPHQEQELWFCFNLKTIDFLLEHLPQKQKMMLIRELKRCESKS